MLPAVKHIDPVVGIDVHMVNIPAPTPIPHPHVGFMLDPREYISAAKAAIGAIVTTFVTEIVTEVATEVLADNPGLANSVAGAADALGHAVDAVTSNPLVAGAMGVMGKVGAAQQSINDFMGANVGNGGGGRPIFINGLLRSTAGTHSYHVPGLHFPLGAGWGGPDARVPSHDAESFMGSKTVLANGDPLSFGALPSLSCWFAGLAPMGHNSAHTNRTYLSLPTAVMLPIPVGRPVLVGGPPIMNMMALASALFKAFRGSALAKKLFRHVPSGFIKCVIFDAEPVNSVTGEVIVQQNDFTVEGRLPLVWDRYYASHDAFDGALGNAWRSPADTRLAIVRDEEGAPVVLAAFPDHLAAFEHLPAAAGWDARVYDWQHGHALYRRADRQGDHLVLRTRDSVEYTFALPPKWEQRLTQLPVGSTGEDATALRLPLARYADLNGNAWHYERHADGTPARLTEHTASGPTGRIVACESGSGPGLLGCISLIDPAGDTHPLVRYEQDKERNLTAVYDALNIAYRFEYAGGRHMVRHTDRNGLSFYYSHQRHDDGTWRVDHAWGDGGLYDYRFVYDLAHLETRLTDSLGHTTILQYNDRMLPVARINPLGGVASYRYDSQGRTCAEIDPAGNTTTWQYDTQGNLLAHTLPDQSIVQTQYNAHLKPVQITDPAGGQWQQSWDERGNLLRQTTPSGACTQYRYDPQGQLVQVTDPAQATTTLAYDALGFLATLTDPLGHTTRFSHDPRGNLLRRHAADDTVTQYRYDAKDRLTECLLPGERTLRCRYNAEDDLIRYIDEAGRDTTFAYYGQGQLTQRTDPDGSITRYHYDTEEQLTGVTNPRGQTWHLKRDPAGQLIEEVDYWGHSRTYTYDPAGHLTRSTDPLGHTLTITCDPLGRITGKHADATESETYTYTYNKLGQLTAARNRYSIINRSYTTDGQLRQETQLQHHTHATLDYTWDPAGQLTQQTHTLQHTADPTLNFTQTQRYTWDALGQPATRQIDHHDPIQFTHDAMGRLTAQHLTARLSHHRHYNGHGQLTRHATRRHNRPDHHTDYHYDTSGNLTQRNDSRMGADHYRYDPLGQLIAHTDPAGKLHQYLYDPNGDRYTTAQKTPDGRTLQHPDGTTWQLDRAGNLTTRTDHTGTQHLTWSPLGRLRTLTTAQQQKYEYLYDALGRRICKTHHANGQLNPTETRTWYMWDGDAMVGELRQTTATSHTHPQWFESKPQWAHKQQQARGTKLHHEARFYHYHPGTFEPLALQTFVPATHEPEATEPEKSIETGLYYYQNDPNGMPLRLTDGEGDIVWEAHYSIFGRVDHLEIGKIDQPLRLQGQYRDEESGLHYNRHRYYDAGCGLFISQDPIGLEGGLNPYRFAPNTIGWVDPLGLANLFQLGTYGSLNESTANKGDGLQAHELLRHEYLHQQGLANTSRLSGNPSIALDLDHHTRGLDKDSRGIGSAHWHESQIRASQGLGKNQFASSLKRELDITTGALRKAGVPSSRVKKLRKQAEKFHKSISKKKQASKCASSASSNQI